jgi:hypothetical protein
MEFSEAFALLTKWKDLNVNVSASLHIPRGQQYTARAQVDGRISVLDEDTLVISSDGGHVEVRLRGCTFPTVQSKNMTGDDLIEAQFDQQQLAILVPTGEMCMLIAHRPMN